MKTKYFFLIAFFALFSTTIVSAQNTESLSGFISLTPDEMNSKGVALYKSGQYVEAVQFFKKAAEQGNALAQYNFGYCYEKGYGIEKNEEEAIKWYRKAAEQGYHNAQFEVGFYEFAKGVLDAMFSDIEEATYHYKEAFKWYLKAAKQGHIEAQYQVGYCYEFGKGTAKNLDEAIKWYKKAAEQGHMEAKEVLQKLQNR